MAFIGTTGKEAGHCFQETADRRARILDAAGKTADDWVVRQIERGS